MENKIILTKKIIWILTLVISMFFLMNFSFAGFQMEWGNLTTFNETWMQINLTNTYSNPIVIASPQYSSTSQIYGVSTWVTNVTSTSFLVRSSNEHLNNTDNIMVHYIVMEEGSWVLPQSSIKVQAGKQSTNKVGSQSVGWNCPTQGETITFDIAFDSNPLVLSTRGSNNNFNSWANTFQNDPASSTSPVTTTQMCQGLSQSKATSPGAIVSNETIYWIAADKGNGYIEGVEFEILWNLQDTGDSGGSWINGYADGIPFSQSWAHTWTGAPNVIVGGITSVAGTDGGWAVIYDTGDTGNIRMFVDEANERSHSGSESGGGWAFNSAGATINTAPDNVNVSFNSSLIVWYKAIGINAIVTDAQGNGTVTSVIVTINTSNSTLYNVSLNPETFNSNTTTNDAENGASNYTAINDGETIGESGEIVLANRTSKLITFTQNYNKTPIIIAYAATDNNNNNPYIPIIHNINTTHANISLCRDAGATTCDNNYIAETVNYAVFDIDKTNNYSWIDVGYVNASTNGGATAFSFNKTFSSAPYVWALPQTYNIGGVVTNGIAGHSWFTSITTTGANIIACDHPGTADSCAGTATEEFAYVAIDINNEDLANFVSGTQSIGNSAWTGVTFGTTYTNANVFVMVNTENGGQDPAYPWATDITSTSANIRYCEIDGNNDCDTHNPEDTVWFAIEDGSIGVGNGGADIEKNTSPILYENVFNTSLSKILNLTLNLTVSDYDNSGSSSRSNNASDLRVELYNGTSWISLGFLNVNNTGMFSISTNRSDILNAWTKVYNRDVRIIPVYFDYYSSMSIDTIEWNVLSFDLEIQDYSSYWTGNWTNLGTCGNHSLTDLFSMDNVDVENHTTYSSNTFWVACPPIVTLISPINYTKVIGNGTLEFEFNVTADHTNLSCDFYLDGIFNHTFNCSGNGNNKYNFTVPRGLFNWSINATDELNLSGKSVEEYFYNILNYSMKVTKSITFINTNQYLIDSYVMSLTDTKLVGVLFDFVDYTLLGGSFTPNYNWTNSTSGIGYIGNIFGWNLNASAFNQSLNYSLGGGGDYYLGKNYIIGLE